MRTDGMRGCFFYLAVVWLFTLVLGCAVSNEGKVDLRRTNRTNEVVVQETTSCFLFDLTEDARQKMIDKKVPEGVLKRLSPLEGREYNEKSLLIYDIRHEVEERMRRELVETISEAARKKTGADIFKLTVADIDALKKNARTPKEVFLTGSLLPLAGQVHEKGPEFSEALKINAGKAGLAGYKNKILASAAHDHDTDYVWHVNPVVYDDLKQNKVPFIVIAGLKKIEGKVFGNEAAFYNALNRKLWPFMEIKDGEKGEIKKALDQKIKVKKQVYKIERAIAELKTQGADNTVGLLATVPKKVFDDAVSFEAAVDLAAGSVLYEDTGTLESRITAKAKKPQDIFVLTENELSKDGDNAIDLTDAIRSNLENIKDVSYPDLKAFQTALVPCIKEPFRKYADTIIKLCVYEHRKTQGPLFQGKRYQLLKNKNYSIAANDSTGKHDGQGNLIPGDALSLHLRSAYISDFSEMMGTHLISQFMTRQMTKRIGEIAIVANAFEELEGRELSFEDMRDGRLVFYSDNVHAGQFLNFNNMPIYGPLTYKGAPFAFRISIFELDVVSKQAKAMLKTVAQAGAVAYPPASPVLDILNSVGETFLSGDQTDTEFRYTMILDPGGGSDLVNHFFLEVGNYVLIREEDRSKNIPWARLMLDENKCKLYWVDEFDTRGKPKEYTESTYLVVEVNKNIGNINVELEQNNFAGLIAALEKKDEDRSAHWVTTHNALMKAARDRERIYNFDKAKTILSLLKDTNAIASEKWSKARELFEMIAGSTDSPAAGEAAAGGPELTDLQVDYILTQLREMANPDRADWGTLERSNIQTAFGTTAPSETEQTKILNLVLGVLQE
ncbi:MAG: hypothetical protein V6Z89_19820 [Desulfobacter sp.]